MLLGVAQHRVFSQGRLSCPSGGSDAISPPTPPLLLHRAPGSNHATESDKHGGNRAASHGRARSNDRRARAPTGTVPTLLQNHHVVLLWWLIQPKNLHKNLVMFLDLKWERGNRKITTQLSILQELSHLKSKDYWTTLTLLDLQVS